MGQMLQLGNGIELYYEDRGRGEVLLLIPGLTCTTEFFNNNLDILAGHYRVITYDPRSQGNSSKSETGNDFLQRGRDLAELVSTLELDNFIIAGWSLGAYDAYAYMQEYGYERVKAFINIDMPPKVIPTAEDDWAEGDLELIRAMYRSILAEGQPYFFEGYAHYMIIREASQQEIDWIVGESKKTPVISAAQIVADANLCDFSELVINLAAEKPVMHYIKQDWSQAALAWLGKYTPSAKTKVMGGHMMFWEESEEFNRSLLEFLDSI